MCGAARWPRADQHKRGESSCCRFNTLGDRATGSAHWWTPTAATYRPGFSSHTRVLAERADSWTSVPPR